jgi:hypothetical protein
MRTTTTSQEVSTIIEVTRITEDSAEVEEVSEEEAIGMQDSTAIEDSREEALTTIDMEVAEKIKVDTATTEDLEIDLVQEILCMLATLIMEVIHTINKIMVTLSKNKNCSHIHGKSRGVKP